MTAISVVIPTKDRVQYLRRTVEMFLSHAEVGEVVIIVDGCQDGTLEYVQAASATDPRIRYIDNVINRGTTYSRNRGVELAGCEYMFTAEDDLELSDNFFAVLLAHMQDTAADIIAGRNIFKFEYESAEESIARSNRLPGPTVDSRTIEIQTGIPTHGDQEQSLLPAPMLGRTEIFRKVRWDESVRGHGWREESDFQLSAREYGYKLVCCPHAISYNLVIENDRGGSHYLSDTKRVKWMVRNNWRFVRKHRELIAREFDAGNLYLFITKFAARRTCTDVILPALVTAKQRAQAAISSSARQLES
jgi:glycosyltransferase involved in cell wall biosynthesis